MEQKEILRILFFLNKMEKNAKDEIRDTGTLRAAAFALTDKADSNRNTVCATYLPNFFDKNGVEFLFNTINITLAIKEFIKESEKTENAKVVAVFHQELVTDENGVEKLFTMRKIRMDDDSSKDDIKLFKVIRKESLVNSDGSIEIPETEFEQVDIE